MALQSVKEPARSQRGRRRGLEETGHARRYENESEQAKKRSGVVAPGKHSQRAARDHDG